MSRSRYLFRRLVLGILVFAGVMVVTFVISRLVPADPTILYAGPRAKPELREQVRIELGLDDPVPAQFARYAGDLLQGDLGSSFRTKRPIVEDMKVFLPATLELVITAILVAVLLGIPLGIHGAAHRGGKIDRVSQVVTVAGVSLPAFWLALLLQLGAALWLGWLPVGGRISRDIALNSPVETVTGFYLVDTALTDNWAAFWDSLKHMILPVLVLATYPIALVSRMTRTSMIESLSQEYVTAARAAGLPERVVLYRFTLKNAIIPTLTVLGLLFAFSITGSVLVEVVFQWPGLGKYITDAILAVDFPVIMAVTLVVTVIYIVLNLAVDLAQIWFDPRVRLD